MEKYIEDVKQGQKVAPDLVESIIRPADPVKEALRLILFKLSHNLAPKSKNSGFQLFGCPEM